MTIHRRLEERLAAFEGSEACVLFGSGYLANVGVIGALAGRGDTVFSDELNHASIVDGCRLSRAEVVVYRHRDIEHLQWSLRRHSGGRGGRADRHRLGVLDGRRRRAAARRSSSWRARTARALVVDEAHATGSLGPGGRGAVAEAGLEGEVDVVVGTLGKALGSYGAYACASAEMVRYLINTRAPADLLDRAAAAGGGGRAGGARAAAKSALTACERLRANARVLRARARRARASRWPTADMHIVPLDRRRRARRDAPLPGGDRARRVRAGDPPADRRRRAPRGCAWRRWPRTRTAELRTGRRACSAQRRARARRCRPRRARAGAREPEPSRAGEPRDRAATSATRSRCSTSSATALGAVRHRAAAAAARRDRAHDTLGRELDGSCASAPFDVERERSSAAPPSRARRHAACAGCSSPAPTRASARRCSARALLAAMVGGRRARARAQAGRDRPRRAGRDGPSGPLAAPTTSCSARAAGMASRGGRAAALRPGGLAPPRGRSSAGERIDAEQLRRGARAAPRARCDRLIVEGVGGLLVPLARRLHRVRPRRARSRLPVADRRAARGSGTINHTLLTLQAARAAGLDVRAVVLTPWPDAPSALERSNRETIARLGEVAVFGLAPVRASRGRGARSRGREAALALVGDFPVPAGTRPRNR